MEVVMGPDSILDQALCRLVDQYQAALLRMCYMYLHDKALAEDAVQETFLKAYTAMASYRGDSSEKTWLMRIAINTCRDMQRSAWFRRVDRRIIPDLLPEASVPFEEVDEEVTLAVMKLPKKLKEVIMLYYYQGMNMSEIAASLEVAQTTVSSRLRNAKKKLRTALERGCFHG